MSTDMEIVFRAVLGTQRGPFPAQLWVRPLPELAANEPAHMYMIECRAVLANRALRDALSLRFGGMFGDWRNRLAIPDLGPVDLMDLPVKEWEQWYSMMCYLRSGVTG